MYCTKCGTANQDDAAFCTKCGQKLEAAGPAPLQAPAETPPPVQAVYAQEPPFSHPAPAVKNRKAKWLFGVIGVVLGAALLAAIFFTAGLLSFSGKTVEGPGFATPEEAATAYLEALRDKDPDRMLSVFAVESYVKNYNFEALVERMKSYNFTYEIRLPNSSEYNRKLNIAARRNQIMNSILLQYMYFQTPDAINDMKPTMLKDSGAAQDFVAKMESDTKDYVFKDLAVTGTMKPEDLSENYSSDMNQEVIARQAKIFGAGPEDVANIAIKFKSGGKDWIFCPQAVRYNGRWYLQSSQGNLANLLGMSVITNGIAPADAIGRS